MTYRQVAFIVFSWPHRSPEGSGRVVKENVPCSCRRNKPDFLRSRGDAKPLSLEVSDHHAVPKRYNQRSPQPASRVDEIRSWIRHPRRRIVERRRFERSQRDPTHFLWSHDAQRRVERLARKAARSDAARQSARTPGSANGAGSSTDSCAPPYQTPTLPTAV